MGITCTKNKVSVAESKSAASSDGKHIEDNQPTTDPPSFNISTNDAEELLATAKPGSYVFSCDVTSDLFISMSVDGYVRHHSISRRGSVFWVGGEAFQSTKQLVEYFKAHPLGDITLKEEFSPLQRGPKTGSIRSNGTHTKSFSGRESCTSPTQNDFVSSEGISVSENSPAKRITIENVTRIHVDPIPETADVEVKPETPPEQAKEVMDVQDDRTSVSSAGEKDLPLDEPLPILPDPYGTRPPPLFPHFSFMESDALSIADPENPVLDSKRKLFQLFKGNTSLNYSLPTRTIKVILCGQPDTFTERKHLMSNCLQELTEYCFRYGYFCDVVNVPNIPQRHTNDNSKWYFDYSNHDGSGSLSTGEIKRLNQLRIPVLTVVCSDVTFFGEKYGFFSVPDEIETDDFRKMRELLKSEESSARLSAYYEKDENASDHRYVLKKGNASDDGLREELEAIFSVILPRCFDSEMHLWKYFAPDAERILDEISAGNKINVVMCERVVTDIDNHILNPDVKHLMDNADGNVFYQLQDKYNKLIMKLKDCNNKAELSRVTIETMFDEVTSKELSTQEIYLSKVNNLVKSSVKQKLDEIMGNLSVDNATSCLHDEILHHILECQRKCDVFVGHNEVLQTMKAYIQGPFSKPLILFGKSGSGKSSVMAKASSMAFQWFGCSSCVVTRFVGSTPDSHSLQLLLRSICLQLSYAYSTDPSAVPQDLSGLIQFLPCLLKFPTASQPLVLFISGLDQAEIFSSQYGMFSFIPQHLQTNVKIVVSINEDSLTFAQAIYKDNNSYKRMPERTIDDATELLDCMLVSVDRTLSDPQKELVCKAVSKCWSPIFVRLLYDKVKKWSSFENVDTELPVDLETTLKTFFTTLENKNGAAVVEIISTLITVSQFGIHKRHLVWAVSEYLSSLTTEAKSALDLVTSVLSNLNSLLKTKWINGIIVFAWTHSQIKAFVKNKYLSKTETMCRNLGRLAMELDNEPSEFKSFGKNINGGLSSTKAFEFERIFQHSANLPPSNNEKIYMLPFYLLRTNDIENFVNKIACRIDFLLQKLKSTSVCHVLNDLEFAITSSPKSTVLRIIKETIELSTEALTLDSEQLPAQVVGRFHSNSSAKRLCSEECNLLFFSESKQRRSRTKSKSSISSQKSIGYDEYHEQTNSVRKSKMSISASPSLNDDNVFFNGSQPLKSPAPSRKSLISSPKSNSSNIYDQQGNSVRKAKTSMVSLNDYETISENQLGDSCSTDRTPNVICKPNIISNKDEDLFSIRENITERHLDINPRDGKFYQKCSETVNGSHIAEGRYNQTNSSDFEMRPDNTLLSEKDYTDSKDIQLNEDINSSNHDNKASDNHSSINCVNESSLKDSKDSPTSCDYNVDRAAIDQDIASFNTKNSNSNKMGSQDEEYSSIDSIAINDIALSSLVEQARKLGHALMPVNRCLFMTQTECGLTAEEQMLSLHQSNDVRFLFLDKHQETFIAWSIYDKAVSLYRSDCTSLQSFKVHDLRRVPLVVGYKTLIETNHDVFIYDMEKNKLVTRLDSDLCYFAACDASHLVAITQDWKCVCVCNMYTRECVWEYFAPKQQDFSNVLVSKNGAIGVCFLESENCNDNDYFAPGHAALNLEDNRDKLIVINLKTRQELHSIKLKRGQYFHKVCAISEDGHYLVHLTEPEYQLLVWDLMNGKVIHELETRSYRILKVLVSTQGNCILTISADSFLRVWNLSDGKMRYALCELIRSIKGGYMDDRHCLSMSEDGRKAVHAVRSSFHRSYVTLWDLVQGKQLGTFTSDYYGLSYQISPSGDYVITYMPSGLVTLRSNLNKAET